jgi:hypothetical protein
MLKLRSLSLPGNVTVDTPAASVVCIVGGNNVGKSQLLRDLQNYLRDNNLPRVILDTLDFEWTGTSDILAHWVRKYGIKQTNPNQNQPEAYHSASGGNIVQISHVEHWATRVQPNGSLGIIFDFFVQNLDSGQRANVVSGSLGTPGMHPQVGPLHQVFRDGDLESNISGICKRHFGFSLTLDRVNGDVMFRVGQPAVDSPPLQQPDD